MNLKSKLIAAGLAGAIALIPVVEGVRLKEYKDSVGIRTDCIGHTGSGVRAVNTLEQCYEKFYGDLAEANRTVDSCVGVALSSNQRSAFASFAFNVGPGRKGVKDGFCTLKSGREPSFLRKLNAGDPVGACNGLLDWKYAGGVFSTGVLNRRVQEVGLCLKP